MIRLYNTSLHAQLLITCVTFILVKAASILALSCSIFSITSLGRKTDVVQNRLQWWLLILLTHFPLWAAIFFILISSSFRVFWELSDLFFVVSSSSSSCWSCGVNSTRCHFSALYFETDFPSSIIWNLPASCFWWSSCCSCSFSACSWTSKSRHWSCSCNFSNSTDFLLKCLKV